MYASLIFFNHEHDYETELNSYSWSYLLSVLKLSSNVVNPQSFIFHNAKTSTHVFCPFPFIWNFRYFSLKYTDK